MTHAQLITVVAGIRYLGWHFALREMGDGYYLQVQFMAPDEQRGRKWYISKHATEAEVLQTALLAVLTAVEHEAREAFTYMGKAVFGPHTSVEALLGRAGQTDQRKEHTT